MLINHDLLALAEYTANHVNEDTWKLAFVPPDAGGGDPSQGGAPPGGDPAAGGAPPGGDPSQGGAPPGPPPGPDPAMLQQMVTQAVQQAMAAQGQQGAAPGAAGPGGAKPAKPDLATIAMDVYQSKKLLFMVIQAMGLKLPSDIIDGPGRDPTTGMPTGQPTGPSPEAPQQMGSSPGAPPDNAIQPVEPVQPASLDAGKQAAALIFGSPADVGPGESPLAKVSSRAAAASAILSRLRK